MIPVPYDSSTSSVLFTVHTDMCGHDHGSEHFCPPVCSLSLEVTHLDVSYLQACSSGSSVSLSTCVWFYGGNEGSEPGSGGGFRGSQRWGHPTQTPVQLSASWPCPLSCSRSTAGQPDPPLPQPDSHLRRCLECPSGGLLAVWSHCLGLPVGARPARLWVAFVCSGVKLLVRDGRWVAFPHLHHLAGLGP